MVKILTAYLATGLVMLVLDIAWLTTTIPIYRQHLGDLLHDGVRLAPAIAFYLLYVAGIVVLAVLPALNANTGATGAALSGAALGLVAYGTYDLTNQATLKAWSPLITAMDMAWGTTLTGIAAAAGAFATSRLVAAVP